MTVKDYAAQHGMKPDTVRKALSRKGLPALRGGHLTDAQLAILSGSQTGVADTPPAPSGQNPDTMKRTKPQVSGTGVRKGALWAVVALALATSVQNMFFAALQMKAHWYSAAMLTAACTFTPALFIYSRASGWGVWLATGGALLYAGYCNTVAVFSALTGLGDSYILAPTPLLEAAASLAGASYQGTALIMSAFLAAVLMAVEVAAIRGISR